MILVWRYEAMHVDRWRGKCYWKEERVGLCRTKVRRMKEWKCYRNSDGWIECHGKRDRWIACDWKMEEKRKQIRNKKRVKKKQKNGMKDRETGGETNEERVVISPIIKSSIVIWGHVYVVIILPLTMHTVSCNVCDITRIPITQISSLSQVLSWLCCGSFVIPLILGVASGRLIKRENCTGRLMDRLMCVCVCVYTDKYTLLTGN